MGRTGTVAIDKRWLDALYARYNRREFVHPDPLEFLYRYDELRDREVAGIVASSLAYGRVGQILNSVSAVLDRMPSPAKFVQHATRESLHRTFAGFKHRFTTGDELAALLGGVKGALERYGSLHACFVNGLNETDDTVLPALGAFALELSSGSADTNSLLPRPARGSPCKRLNLFLRWMVRRDQVDPGGWTDVSPSRLIVPLDTHMFRIGRAVRFTVRNQADMRAAIDITTAFRVVAPDDPVRYDFALTRLGIRSDTNMDLFMNRYGTAEVAHSD